MFNLQNGELNILIETEGVPYYSRTRDEFIGYLPSLSSYFMLDEVTEQLCHRNLSIKNYDITLQDSLIKLSSKVDVLPVCSVLYKNSWLKKASDLLEIDDNFNILIPDRPDVPIFCGHKRFVNRLAENFTGDIYNVKALDFIQKWSKA